MLDSAPCIEKMKSEAFLNKATGLMQRSANPLSSGMWNKYLCISITIFCSANTAEEPVNIRKGCTNSYGLFYRVICSLIS